MTKQITPLRQRMLDDMALRNMSPATQRGYINAVKNFSAFSGRSPDKLTSEDVRTTSFISSHAGSSHHHQPDPVRLAVLLRHDAGPARRRRTQLSW
jgi:Phage integrase, N-terminal SAM-like domain